MIKKTIYLLFYSLVATGPLLAQSNKSLADAERYFGVKSYDVALPKFLEAIQAGEKSGMVYYKTGVCYQKSPELAEQIKAIPYYEYALTNTQGLPTSLYYDLGSLYLKDENVQKAIENFTKFREVSNKADKKAMMMADEAIQTCHNAVALMSVPRNFKVNYFNSFV